MKCHSKSNVTHNGMSLTRKYHLKWNITAKKCHSKCKVTQMECHLKWNLSQNGMSL